MRWVHISKVYLEYFLRNVNGITIFHSQEFLSGLFREWYFDTETEIDLAPYVLNEKLMLQY